MKRGALISVLLFALAAAAAPVASAAPRPIVYVVVIDGLDGDRVDPTRTPFISSLIAGQGARTTLYRESRSVMVAETNPNHTAMVTGAYGERSGIPGNSFALYGPLENEDSCRLTGPVDETRLPSVTSGENPNCPLAQTVFEAIRRQGNPDGLLTAGVFGKPKLGRIFAGRRFDGRSRDVDHLWAPCTSGADDDDYCGNVPLNPANGYAVDDKTVMDEVLRTVRQGVGPQRRRPDFTFVNLHQVDSAGHAFGAGAGAYDAAITQADDEIERLVTELRARGEWGRTALIFSSDHSMDTTPTKTTLTSRFEAAGVPESEFITVQNGSLDMVYLANRTSPGRFDLLRRMRAAALATPGVAEAFYRESNPADGGNANSLAGTRYGWRLAGPRTGDLVVTHREGGSFSDPSPTSNPLPGNHGGPQSLDNFFAVAGGGFVRQGTPLGTAEPRFYDTLVNPFQAENVDPAPTLMGLLGLAAPRDNAGRFLTEAFDLAAVPGGAAPARRARVGVRRTSRRLPRKAVRSRSACRRLRATRVRVRLSLAPAAGRYDVQVRRRGRRYRSVARNRAKNPLAYRALPGRRLRFRARLVAASGRAGPWGTSRAVRIRPVRCARR